MLKPAAGGGQVPAAATVSFSLRPAVVADEDAVPGSAQNYPVSVSDTGDLRVDDAVRVGDGPAALEVAGVLYPNQVMLRNPQPTLVTLESGVKLTVTGRIPQVYADPLGAGNAVTTLQTDPSTGRASAFLQANRVNYEVSIPGQPVRSYVDAAGRMGRSNQRWSDLRDFGGSLERALAALPGNGGVIFVPRGEWLLPNPITILKDGVTLTGEGHGSVLRAAPGMTSDLITVDRPYFRMRDLTVDGGATAHDPAGACCVVVRGLGLAGTLVLGQFFDNVRFTRAARHGLWLRDLIASRIENCLFEENLGNGAVLDTPDVPNPGGTTTIQFIGCTFARNGAYGVPDGAEELVGRGCYAKGGTSLLFSGCRFEGNTGGFHPVGGNDYVGNALTAVSCIQLQVQSCTFRSPRTPVAAGGFVALNNCHSSLVDGCYFDGGEDTATTKRPKVGVVFDSTSLGRISSCVGYRLLNFLAWVDGFSFDCVEFGNTEVEQASLGAPARLRTEPTAAQRLIGASRRSLSAPEVGEPPVLPTDEEVTPGAFLWRTITNQLLMWDGEQWREVPLIS